MVALPSSIPNLSDPTHMDTAYELNADVIDSKFALCLKDWWYAEEDIYSAHEYLLETRACH